MRNAACMAAVRIYGGRENLRLADIAAIIDEEMARERAAAAEARKVYLYRASVVETGEKAIQRMQEEVDTLSKVWVVAKALKAACGMIGTLDAGTVEGYAEARVAIKQAEEAGL